MKTASQKIAVALQHHQAGRTKEAEKIYNEILRSDPNNDMALYFSGIIAYQRGDIQTAIQNISKAVQISPQPDYCKDLGDIFFELKDFQRAAFCFQKTLELSPESVEVFFSLGIAFLNLDQLDNSIVCFNKTIQVNPQDGEAYHNLGLVLHKKGNLDSAESCYLRAVELNPNYPDSHNNLANVYKDKRQYQNAINSYLNAIQLKPDCADYLFNLAVLLQNVNKIDDAIKCYEKALSLNFNDPAAFINLGYCLQLKNDTQKAINCYENGLKLFPDNSNLKFNLGSLLIKIREFERGFELFENRIDVFPHHKLKFPTDKYPKWDGTQFLVGKTIYVYFASAEFGLGDSILFSRYLPLLQSKGAKIICKVQSGLEKLFRDSDLKAEIISQTTPEDNINFDFQIPFMSLPYAFRTIPETIPFKEGYLKADKDKVEFYKNNYFNNDKLKVGIVWHTSSSTDSRTMKLEHFLPLAGIDGIKLYSLQKGAGREQLENLSENIEITDLGSTFNDFSDTAAAVKNLDLVISPDTSVVHLAGGIGKPVWILVPYLCDWKWLLDTDETLWFDEGKLFRQKEPENWHEVIKRVYSDLNSLINN